MLYEVLAMLAATLFILASVFKWNFLFKGFRFMLIEATFGKESAEKYMRACFLFVGVGMWIAEIVKVLIM